MSQTIAGLLVALISQVWSWLGWEIFWVGDELTKFITGILTLGGILYAWYQRVKKGDVSAMGIRK